MASVQCYLTFKDDVSLFMEVRHGTMGCGGFSFGSKPFRNNRSTRWGGGVGSYGSFQNGLKQELVENTL